MSEIIETYQEEQERLASPELPGMAFATVVSVNEDGLELRFDGEEEAASKRYPCNVGVTFEPGQRALLMKVNGSYVALCPVGLQGGGGGGGGGGSSEVLMHRKIMTVTSKEDFSFSLDISNAGKTPIGIVGLTTDARGVIPIVYRAYLSAASYGAGTITGSYFNATENTESSVFFDFYVLWQ